MLTEWRNNQHGQFLRNELHVRGYQTAVAAAPTETNSVLLAAEDLFGALDVTPADAMAGGKLLMGDSAAAACVGCYYPGLPKMPFFARCADLGQTDRPLLMLGDFNTGSNELDRDARTKSRFSCTEGFHALTGSAGLVDLWRHQHGSRQDWTFYSSRGNGFRIDHAFANQAFVDRFPAYQCAIDHHPRTSGMTDHSAVVVDA